MMMLYDKWRASTAPQLFFPHHAIFIVVFVFHINAWIIAQKQKKTYEFILSATPPILTVRLGVTKFSPVGGT
jgi:hypothetical protein